jgi:hypothetical protein
MKLVETGTFLHCTDAAAFGDTIEINLGGDVQTDWTNAVLNVQSLPIGGEHSSYARERQGTLKASGNRVAVKHGRRKQFPNVPRLKLRLHSECNPVTGSQTVNAVKALTQNCDDVRVSWIEMTYDLTGETVYGVYQQVFSRACFGPRYFGRIGLETFYRGTRKSSWSLRVYSKTPEVTRFEYIFRRSFLCRKGITEAHDLTRLRMINLRRIATCRVVDQYELGSLLARLRQPAVDFILRLATSHPQLAERALRKEYRLDTTKAFPVSDLQLKLERMQQNFIW